MQDFKLFGTSRRAKPNNQAIKGSELCQLQQHTSPSTASSECWKSIYILYEQRIMPSFSTCTFGNFYSWRSQNKRQFWIPALLEDTNSTDCSDGTKSWELQARDLTPSTFAAPETGTVKCSIPRTRAEKCATCAYVHTHHKKKASGHGKPQTDQ